MSPIDGSPLVLVVPDVGDRLHRLLGDSVRLWGPAVPWPDALGDDPRLAETRIIVCYGSTRITAEIMDRMPKLGLICIYASGYEGTDRAAARARGIAVCHSPGANAPMVADLAMGLILATVRRIAEADRVLRSDGWAAARKARVQGLAGRVLGIWGLGAIGLEIARRAEPFGLTVLYHNRTPRPDVPYRCVDTLEALAAESDLLMVAARAGPDNRHAVNARVLAALGPQGFVFNIARGSAIDETALIAALQSGGIAGAGLDVFEGEPNIAPALMACPNLVMTPHLGGNTLDSAAATDACVAENVRAFLSEGRPRYPVPAA